MTITGFIITGINPNFTSESELTVISDNEANLQSVAIQIVLQLNAYIQERYNGINNMKSNPLLTTNIDLFNSNNVTEKTIAKTSMIDQV